VNRAKGPFGGPGITAASASNSQEIDLFVALEDGVYLFDARRHRAASRGRGDLRAMAIGPGQKNVTMKAPVQLLYVVDLDRLTHTSGLPGAGAARSRSAEVLLLRRHGAHRRQRVSVRRIARARGLVSQLRPSAGLSRKLKLRAEQRVLFGQTVGYPERS
jgi:hypothetical protein